MGWLARSARCSAGWWPLTAVESLWRKPTAPASLPLPTATDVLPLLDM